MKAYHWVETLAEKIAEVKKEPFVVSSGLTPSGSAHMGTVCEFLYPSIIYSRLKAEKKQAKFFFVIDIMDAFDGIPSDLEDKRKELEPHLGKPLCNVPDPHGCCGSYGMHFLNKALEVISKLDIDMPELLAANKLYQEGKYDSYAMLFFREIDIIKEIIERTSMRKLGKDWSPIMPICSRCGKIATTRVLSFNLENGEYEYSCDRDTKYTKGCGFIGKEKIENHNYKITWRLDWPARQDFLTVSVEGAGVDHMTKGGSWDTSEVIHREIFKTDPLLSYKYGFVMLEGKKYSKSKGIGLSVLELLELMPPEVLKYALLRPDIEENIDFKPDPLSLLIMIEEYSNAAGIAELVDAGTMSFDGLKRHEQKKVAAAKLAGLFRFGKSPTELFMYRSIYGTWDAVEEIIGKIDGELKGFADRWIAKGLVPEEYSFEYSPKQNEISREFFARINPSADATVIHNAVFDFAKKKELGAGEVFKQLYSAMIGRERGPKLGKLVFALGVERVKKDFEG